MSIINTLDGLRYYELGPVLSHLNSEVEIKNLYRILRVIQPFISRLDARGGLDALSLDSVGAGTSLIFNNELPDFLLRSLVAGTSVTLTTSADGKEITIAVSGAGVGNHQLSDGVVHADVGTGAGKVDTNEEDGSFLSWDGSSNNRWELSKIANAGSDDVTGPDYNIGVFHAFEANIVNFGGESVIGGRHTMRDIAAINGSFITLALSGSNIQIAFDKTNFNMEDIADAFYTGTPEQFDILQRDAAGKWTNFSHFLVLTSTSNGTASFMRCRRQRTGPAAVQSGDILFKMDYQGWDGSFWSSGAKMIVTATENFSVGNNGTKIEFQTTPNGSGTLATRLTIDQDGGVAIPQTLAVTGAITSSADIDADTIDAAGTARDWDNVLHTKQRPLSFVDFVTAGTDAATWLTGAIGHVLAQVASGTPPAESVVYAGQIPAGFSATPVLKWRFYNNTIQINGDQKTVVWRVQYNSPGSSGTIGAVDTGTPTSTLATNQAANTIKEESLALSNVAAGDLFNVTFSVNTSSTLDQGEVVLLGVPWIEFVQAGVSDTGSAS